MRKSEEIIEDMKSATTSLDMLNFYQELKATDYSRVEASKLYNELRRKLINNSVVVTEYKKIESVPIMYNRVSSAYCSVVAGANNIYKPSIFVKGGFVYL